MTADEAMAFVREHGVVLASAKGPVPRLADVIAGESIKGSWWAHAKSHDIFNIIQEVGESPDILIRRLVNGKVPFVLRRLWPRFASSGTPLRGKSARAGASRTLTCGPSCPPRALLPQVGATGSCRRGAAANRAGGMQRPGSVGHAAQKSVQADMTSRMH